MPAPPLRPHRQPHGRDVRRAAPALLTALVFLNATARYLFSHSFIWGDELIIALIPWVAMSGLFLAVRRRNVIRIDFFLDKFPPRPRKVLRLAGELVSAVMFVYLAWVSVEYVQLFGGDQLVYLRWPTGVFSSSFVIGPLLAALAYLVTFWREARSGAEAARRPGDLTHDRRRGLDRAAPRASGPRRADAGRAAGGRGRELLPERPVASDPAADDDLGVSSFTLIALPLFVLAGTIMNAGGISGRLFEFARALVGWLRAASPRSTC